MISSLDKRDSDLNGKPCENLRKFYLGKESFKLMRSKFVYSSEDTRSSEKFEEIKLQLKVVDFYNKLNMKGDSDQDYEHAQQAWNRITHELENVTSGNYNGVYLAAGFCTPVSCILALLQ